MVNANNHGGPRETRVKIWRRERIQHFMTKWKKLPLDFFMEVLNAPEGTKFDGEKITFAMRMAAAQMASPFVHQRLAQLELKTETSMKISQKIDPRRLNDDELRAFESLVAKAQVPQVIDGEVAEELVSDRTDA